MTYKELIEECKKRELTIVDDNGKFSVLDKQKIMSDFSLEIPTWQNSLKIFFSKLN